MGITLFWFRRDLRLEDNHGLYQALKKSKKVTLESLGGRLWRNMAPKSGPKRSGHQKVSKNCVKMAQILPASTPNSYVFHVWKLLQIALIMFFMCYLSADLLSSGAGGSGRSPYIYIYIYIHIYLTIIHIRLCRRAI